MFSIQYIEGTRFPKTGTTGRGKVWKTTGVLCAANSTHHVEINCVGLNFLMKVRLKQLWVETIIKMRQYRVEGRKVLHGGKYYVAEHSKTPELNKGDKFIIV